ncbi:hypothetical protein ABBQ32_002334 [Trebouxia sp. C0010 RCD-2024]
MLCAKVDHAVQGSYVAAARRGVSTAVRQEKAEEAKCAIAHIQGCITCDISCRCAKEGKIIDEDGFELVTRRRGDNKRKAAEIFRVEGGMKDSHNSPCDTSGSDSSLDGSESESTDSFSVAWVPSGHGKVGGGKANRRMVDGLVPAKRITMSQPCEAHMHQKKKLYIDKLSKLDTKPTSSFAAKKHRGKYVSLCCISSLWMP